MPQGPLDGIRVIDFGQVWAGPLLGEFLSDYGAQVIRIASAAREGVQGGARQQDLDPANPRTYDAMGRNRLQLSLDPNTEGGQEIFHRLVAVSDVVFDNFSPRGAAKIGIDYAVLKRVNPHIIVASLSAAGKDGPWSDLVTYGPSLNALYGVKSLYGYPGESRILEDVADLDPTAAAYGLIVLLAALRHRDRTGEGQFIDMAQGEAGATHQAEAVLEYTLNGRVMRPHGNHHRTMAPHGIYPAAGEDRWIAIAVDSEATWRALCATLPARALVADSRYADMYARLRHRHDLDEAIAACTVAWDADALTEALQAAGVAAYPAHDSYGALADPQYAYRRQHARVEIEGVDSITPGDLYTTAPWRGSEMLPRVYMPLKRTGTDTEYVLAQILGMSDAEIERARQAGALG